MGALSCGVATWKGNGRSSDDENVVMVRHGVVVFLAESLANTTMEIRGPKSTASQLAMSPLPFFQSSCPDIVLVSQDSSPGARQLCNQL